MSEGWRAVQTQVWADRDAWPEDVGDAEFLPRALQRVGRAYFGSEWRGDELGVMPAYIEPHLPKPGKTELFWFEIAQVRAVLSARYPDEELPPLSPEHQYRVGIAPAIVPPASPVTPPPSIARTTPAAPRVAQSVPSPGQTMVSLAAGNRFFRPTQVDVERARRAVEDLRDAHNAKYVPLVARRDHVWATVRRLGVEPGSLDTFWLSRLSGKMFVFEPGWWNLDNWRAFVSGMKVDWELPSLTGNDAKRASYLSWIFLRKTHVDVVVQMTEKDAKARAESPANDGEPPGWWPKGQGVLRWMASPATQAEALKRVSGTRKADYARTLLPMWNEAVEKGNGLKPLKLATFTKALQGDDPAVVPVQFRKEADTRAG